MIDFLLKYFSRYSWPAVLWTLLILIGCTLPGRDLPSVPVSSSDKIAHTGLFAVLTILWLIRFPRKEWLVVPAAVAYGIFLEFYQEWLPFDRSFEWWDAVADGWGVMLGFLVFRLLISRFL